MKSQPLQNSELNNNPTPDAPVQTKTENTHVTAQSKLPPVQTKQGKQASIQSKEGQKQRPVQRNALCNATKAMGAVVVAM